MYCIYYQPLNINTMSFTKKSLDYGVLRIKDSTKILMYETQSQFITINVGKPIEDFRLNGDNTVTVYLVSGEIRKYNSPSNYLNIKF